ncbi:MAG: glycosyltransferase [Proteobacteria bacterium]|nr:glycosyltransferase [Pseudomonadota bacterium]
MSARDTLVSVVAVVCNAEEYIERYVLDVAETLASEYRYYEIVLVDDGSTDRTVEQIEALQQRVNNIQLYCLPEGSR